MAREALDAPYFILTFRHPEVAREARAGQFVMIKAGLSAEPPLRRPFSVLAVDPVAETFSLFIKAIGPGTRALAALCADLDRADTRFPGTRLRLRYAVAGPA